MYSSTKKQLSKKERKMNLEDVFKKTEKELSKIKKADIIKITINSTGEYENDKRVIRDLRAKLEMSKGPYDQDKLLVCGAAGIDVQPISDYDKRPDLDRIDLCYAIGVLIAKNSDLLSK